MNRTNFEHAFVAVLMQLFLWLLTSDWWIGAAFGAAFFLGREHAQVQRKHQINEFEAIKTKYWSTDARLDLIFPVVAVIIVAIAGENL